MKKIFSLFILVIMIFTLVACGNETTNDATDNDNNDSSFMASNNTDAQESVEPEITDSEADAQGEDEAQPEKAEKETQSEQSDKDSKTDTNETKESQESNKDDEPEIKDEPVNDRFQGYDIYATDRGLAIYYYNTGNEEILIKPDNTIFNVEYLIDSPIIYYDVYNGTGDNDIFEFNLNNWQNIFIYDGYNLENIIDYGPYTGYLICSSSYMGTNGLQYDFYVVDSYSDFEVYIGDYYDMSDITNQIDEALYPSDTYYWLENEYVHNQYIDYSGYSAVVIEQYDGINYDVLEPMYGSSDAYDNPTASYDIAVFGTIYYAQLLSYSYMDSEPVITEVGEELTDVWIFADSSFPTDFSYDLFTFYDSLGNYHEIVIEDMSGQNAIEFCYAY